MCLFELTLKLKFKIIPILNLVHMEKIIIQKQICIEPKFMDSNIMEHIMTELTRSCCTECNKDYGYIIKINRIIKILDNYINMDSNIVFDIKFEASCLNPKSDRILKGNVCMVFPDGIFIDVMKKMQILIPKQFIVGYVFNKKSNSFIKEVESGENISISEGKQLKVSITASQYNNQRFSVFGTIVDLE